MINQKLGEVNLGEMLREQEVMINQDKLEIKNLDQELIMVKIESAMIKCQIEVAELEELEISGKKITTEDAVVFDSGHP